MQTKMLNLLREMFVEEVVLPWECNDSKVLPLYLIETVNIPVVFLFRRMWLTLSNEELDGWYVVIPYKDTVGLDIFDTNNFNNETIDMVLKDSVRVDYAGAIDLNKVLVSAANKNSTSTDLTLVPDGENSDGSVKMSPMKLTNVYVQTVGDILKGEGCTI